jgi:hypothetical protein
METFSDAVRRGRDDEILSDAASVIASAALTAAERWLRRDDMMDREGTRVGGFGSLVHINPVFRVTASIGSDAATATGQ